ncbi:MAG: aminomethyltransferase beta-barrel domain-containing protein [Candidatus Eisenbacteria bacterium]
MAIEPATNVLRVGDEADLGASGVWASDLNLFLDRQAIAGRPVEVKIRYRHEAAPAEVRFEGDRVHVRFRDEQRAVAPGQSCVLYREGLLLGGGRIDGRCDCCARALEGRSSDATGIRSLPQDAG